MSYILEALAKSEEERKQRAVPDLQTQHTLYPGVSRSRARRMMRDERRLRPGLLLSLFILLSLAAVYHFRDAIPVALEIKILRQSVQVPSVAEKELPANNDTVADTQAFPENTLSQNRDRTTTDRIDSASASPSEEVLSSPDIEISPTGPITPAESIASPSHPQAYGEEHVIAEQHITLEPAPILFSENGEVSSIVTVTTLPFLEELPASIQNDLPTMKFAGHTYSDTPDNRLIIINNSIKRQGEPLQQGLRLEEITWDGVILNYKGLRFQVITTNS